MANINPKLEQLALKIGGTIYDCKCFKYVEVTVIYAKGKAFKFEGDREVFYYEAGDEAQVLVDNDQLIYTVDEDADKLVRTVSKVGTNKLLNAMKAKKVKTFDIEVANPEADTLEGKYKYFIATPFKDSKAFKDYVSIKKYNKPKEGLYGEITYNQLLQPKEMVRLELVSDDNNKKQSYDLDNGSDKLDKNSLRDKLISMNIRDKDDLYSNAMKMYNEMNAAKQYFIDDKYLKRGSLNDLDIISLARAYIDLQTLKGI